MKLLLQRDQADRGVIGTTMVFSLNARVELTKEEAGHVDKYKMGSTILVSDTDDRGPGLLEWLRSKATGLEVTVYGLVSGTEINCKDILEMIEIEEQIKEACEKFKKVLDTAALFGGEEIIEF
jgi:hypothetical protein